MKNAQHVKPDNEDKRNIESSEKILKRSIFWDKGKKRPSVYTFLIIIAIWAIFIAWVISETVLNIHEIEVVFEYGGHFEAEIYFGDNYEYIAEQGRREMTRSLHKVSTISISFRKADEGTELLSVELYDNGQLVTRRGVGSPGVSMNINYVVGGG
jgi:hypothetical protein